MISTAATSEFVPFGREFYGIHPSSCPSLAAYGQQRSTSLTDAVKGICIADCQESWRVRQRPAGSSSKKDGMGEEELYIRDCTVIWSAGRMNDSAHVIKTFTVSSPVKDALWCTFILPKLAESISGENIVEMETGICVIESRKVSMFTAKGHDYITSTPFQIAAVWPLMHGLLFERCLQDSELPGRKLNAKSTPVWYSMLHPLDEVSPVICRSGSRLFYVVDKTHQLVFTCDDPGIAVTYDVNTGQHSVWSIRKATIEEGTTYTGSESVPAVDISSCVPATQNLMSAYASMYASLGTEQAHSRFTLSSHSPSLSPRVGRVGSALAGATASPATAASSSLPAAAGSFLNPSLNRTNPGGVAAASSPSGVHLSYLAAMSRMQSTPSASSLSIQKILTPPPLLHRDNSPAVLARGSVAASIGQGCNESSSDFLPPVLPDLCLEHLYTACTPPSSYARSARASKVFVSSDLVGQRYLCFLLPSSSQLWCFKFDKSNNASLSLIFGSSSVMPAKDAAPVTSLGMTLVLDPAGNLILYSGSLRVVQVHVPSSATLAATPGPFKHVAGSTPGPSAAEGAPGSTPGRPGNAVTSSRPPSALDFRLDDDVSMLSPVQTELNESAYYLTLCTNDDSTSASGIFSGIKDCVNNRVTLHAGSGTYCTTSLPSMSNSALVSLCIKAVANSLSRDVVQTFLLKWYLMLNSPGRLFGTTEWQLFQSYLHENLGFGQQLLRWKSRRPEHQDASPEKSPVLATKRARTNEDATEQDWQYLLQSEFCKEQQQICRGILNLGIWKAAADDRSRLPREQLFTTYQGEELSVDHRSLLAPHATTVFFALHLTYEELKLAWLQTSTCRLLASFLLQVAWTLRSSAYVDAYYRDFPGLLEDDELPVNVFVKPEDKAKLLGGAGLYLTPPSLSTWLLCCMQSPVNVGQAAVPSTTLEPFPYIPDVCINICHIVKLHAMAKWGDDLLTNPDGSSRYLKKVLAPGRRAPVTKHPSYAGHSQSECNDFIASCQSASERMVLYMAMYGLSKEVLVAMPCGYTLPLWEAILKCRENPPPHWPAACYRLIGREDLAAQVELEGNQRPQSVKLPLLASKYGTNMAPADQQSSNGMESVNSDVLSLRFGEDLRVKEVMRCLQSSAPVQVTITQRPEVSDHEFIEERERHLLALCQRTMALPLGRGAFTLSTYEPIATEAMAVPRLCLTGRAPPRNTTVDLSHIEAPANMAAWPQFHNGVASGLRVTASAQIDSAWILYNKPKGTGTSELMNEHAGFLMALGLNGHLPKLATMNMHDYLIRGHEMTSIGVLLGLAAAKRASMDLATVRLLGIHVPALLPPTSTELDIAHNVQVAALLGVGLVYQGTAHRHITEVLLDEIDRPPGPDTENSVDRESYSLAAGLALGMTMLCRGNDTAGLADLNIPSRLYTMIASGHRARPARMSNNLLLGARARPASCAIKEGDTVNTDVTGPGAMLALGLMFFNTCNSSVGDWLTIPETQFLIEFIRPDFLLLRVVSRNLVFWDCVTPSESWIESILPPIIARHAFQRRQADDSGEIDYETMSQAYCSLVAGACMSMGLRFAGTANKSAFLALMKYVKKLLAILNKPSLSDQAGKASVENALVVCLLSLSMVMAGTGNVEVLRICRHLRARPTTQTATGVVAGYGSHMAVHLALGLLFLGGGRASLGTTPEAVAVMLCAFFPRFPTSSNDNRYHLQAFRHLYVLATEHRVLCPRDVDTNVACRVPIEITLKETNCYQRYVYRAFAPCLLPEVRLLEKVEILEPRYWPVVFSGSKNWKKLRFILSQQNGTVYVKQRAGHLTYALDPMGYRSKLSQALLGKSIVSTGHLHLSGTDPITFASSSELMRVFAADPAVSVLINEFLTGSSRQASFNEVQTNADVHSEGLFQRTAFMSMALAECLTTERLELLPVYLHMEQVLNNLLSEDSSLGLWQLKLVAMHAGSGSVAASSASPSLMSGDLLQSVFHGVKAKLETKCKFNAEFDASLSEYLRQGFTVNKSIYKYFVWFNVPSGEVLAKLQQATRDRQQPLGFISILKILQSSSPLCLNSAATAAAVAKEVCEILSHTRQ